MYDISISQKNTNLAKLIGNDLQIDLSNLPLSMVEMIKQIGLPATIKITENYGGTYIKVPKVFSDAVDPKLIEILGEDGTKALIEKYPGEQIWPPKGDSLMRQIKRKIILAMHARGDEIRDIAIAVNYTMRHIERLLSEPNRPIQNSLSLFDDL